MHSIILSIRQLKSTISDILKNVQFASVDAGAFQGFLLEISRLDKANAVNSPEMFAAKCGFKIEFRDHQSIVRFSK